MTWSFKDWQKGSLTIQIRVFDAEYIGLYSLTKSNYMGLIVALVVNSMPKSGTHLATRVLELAGLTRDMIVHMGSKGAERYAKRVLFLPSGEIVTASVPLGETNCGLVSRREFRRRFAPLSGVPKERYVSGHMLWSRYAAKYFASSGVKMIVIMRDPRAVALSHIHWALDPRHVQPHPLFERYSKQSMAECFKDEFFGIPDVGLPDYPSHLPMLARYRNMMMWRRLPHIHFTTFEALVGPRGGGDETTQYRAVSDILKFIGSDISPSMIIKDLWGKSATFRHGTIDGWRKNASDIPPEADRGIDEMLRIVDWAVSCRQAR